MTFGCAFGMHSWEQWKPYSIITTTDHFNKWDHPLKSYFQSKSITFHQVRRCKKCAFERRREVTA